jgi:hypothetical protein
MVHLLSLAKERTQILDVGIRTRPMPVAEPLLGSWVRIPLGAWMFVSCTVFVLSGRVLCDGPIPPAEESYRL